MHGDDVLLLGIAPESPEEGYGWIEPGARLHCTAGGSVFEVRRFWEKPSRETAKQLMSAGGLWNTFIMVGRVSAFLSLIRHSLPDLLAPFESMWAAIQPGTEDSALENLFSKIPASVFLTTSYQPTPPVLPYSAYADWVGLISVSPSVCFPRSNCHGGGGQPPPQQSVQCLTLCSNTGKRIAF
jgi:mannose-1-phosphate guanylyltransferase